MPKDTRGAVVMFHHGAVVGSAVPEWIAVAD
jgi:hypothetical protein